MRNRSVALCFWLALTGPGLAFVRAADPLPAATIRALAARTVVIRTPAARRQHATGFVWKRVNGVSQVLTVLEREAKLAPNAKVEVISQIGTKEERHHEGVVMVHDPGSSLAVIEVSDVSLPKPLPCSTAPIKAGAEICLATYHANVDGVQIGRTVAVNPMHLGANRTSERGALLQLDGDVPPGGEGGPVALPSGEVVGIAYLRWDKTLIGFAIPIAHTQALTTGKPLPPKAWVDRRDGPYVLRVSVPLLDLERKIGTCSLHFTPVDPKNVPVPPKDGTWSLLRDDMVSFEVPVTHPRADWQRPLLDLGFKPRAYWVQFRTTLRDGTTFVSRPVRIWLPKSPTKADIRRPPPHADIATVQCLNDLTSPPLCMRRIVTRQIGNSRFTEFRFAYGDAAVPPVTTTRRSRPKATDKRIAWDATGATFYVLSGSSAKGSHSRISRFDLPANIAAAQAALTTYTSAIHPTRWGLVAVQRDRGLLLLDPATLAVRNHLSVPGIVRLHVPAQGNHAIGLSYAKYQRQSRDHAGEPAALHVLNLADWRVEHIYRGTAPPLPPNAVDAKPLGFSLAEPMCLTDDGTHLVLSVKKGKQPHMVVYPFQNGELAAKPNAQLDWSAKRLTPVPGSSRVMASLGYRSWRTDFPRPEGGPIKGSPSIQVFDAANPTITEPRICTDLGAPGTENRFLLFGKEAQALRGGNLTGTPELTIPLPRLSKREASIDHLFPARSLLPALLAAGPKWYLLEPPSPDAAPEAHTARATGRQLNVVSGQSHDMQWQRLITHTPQDRLFLQTGPDRRTAYLLGQDGVLSRIDLASQTETTVAHELGACTGLALAKAGLVTALAAPGALELHLRDPVTLLLRQRWALPEIMTSLVSHPALPVVLMTNLKRDLLVFDCETGQIVRSYSELPLPKGMSLRREQLPDRKRPPLPAVARDGKAIFAARGGYLIRFRLAGRDLVPVAVAANGMGGLGFLATDEDGAYVGAIADRPVKLTGEWQPQTPRSTRGKGNLIVFTADTLLPIYQVNLPELCSFVFDRGGSQLVTNDMARCRPDGSTLYQQRPKELQPAKGQIPLLVHGEDDWLMMPFRDGLLRFRFGPGAVDLNHWQRESR